MDLRVLIRRKVVVAAAAEDSQYVSRSMTDPGAIRNLSTRGKIISLFHISKHWGEFNVNRRYICQVFSEKIFLGEHMC